MKNILKLIVLKLTRKIWNKEVMSILLDAYNIKRIINSEQLHYLASKFDSTQFK